MTSGRSIERERLVRGGNTLLYIAKIEVVVCRDGTRALALVLGLESGEEATVLVHKHEAVGLVAGMVEAVECLMEMESGALGLQRH